MARRRYISTKISTDKQINKLAMEYGDFAVLLYTWMIPHAEDNTEITGDYEELLLTVCPGRRDKTTEDIKLAVGGMLELKLIYQTEIDGRPVLSFPSQSFYTYQTYVKEVRRKTPQIIDEHRNSLQIIEEHRKTPQITASLTHSHSLSHSPLKDVLLLGEDSEIANPDKEHIKFIQTILENSGLLHPSITEILEVEQWLKEQSWDIEILKEAAKEMALNNKRQVSYIIKIFKRWSDSGFKTLSAIKADQQSFEQRKQRPKQKSPPLENTSKNEGKFKLINWGKAKEV